MVGEQKHVPSRHAKPMTSKKFEQRPFNRKKNITHDQAQMESYGLKFNRKKNNKKANKERSNEN